MLTTDAVVVERRHPRPRTIWCAWTGQGWRWWDDPDE